MAKKGKRFKAILEKIDKEKEYSLKEAIDLAKECATAKFDESVEIHIKLGVDPQIGRAHV